MIKEFTLINQIKSAIAYHYLNSNSPLHADDVLAICGVYLFVNDEISFFDKSEDINKYGTINPIYKVLQKYLKKKEKAILKNYSKRGLLNCFRVEWCQPLTLEIKRKCLKGITLISNIEEEGYISLRGNDKVYEVLSQKRVQLENKLFGNADYEPKANSSTLQTTESVDANTNSESENDLKEILSQLNSFWETNIYNENYQKSMPLVWKLDISYRTYNELKVLLMQVIQALPQNARRRNSILINLAEKILVYVALWYRWEYQGRGNNALESIEITQRARFVWENSPLSYMKYLYIPKEEENRNTSWLYSLYVLGGFPLKYVCDNEKRFASLFKDINNPDIDEDTLLNISNKFDNNNSVYFRSLVEGSFKEYISDIMNGNRHIAQEDLGRDEVKAYIEFIEKGKIEYYNDFFKIVWNLYIEPSTSLCDCILNLEIGPKNNRCYIPEELLRRFQIPNVDCLKEFFLYIDYNDGEKDSKPIRFSRTSGRGSSFVGWGNTNIIKLPIIPKIGASIKVKITSADDISRTFILKEFSVKGYFYLFKSNNPYEWSSSTNNKAQSLLLFNPSHYSLNPLDDNVRDIKVGTDEELPWLLHYLYDDTQLEDLQTKEILDFKIKKGVLSIDFKRLPNTIQYNKKNEITYSYFVDDEILNESMPLMLGKNGISKVIFNPFKQGESPKTYKPGKDNDLIIKYKQDTFDYKTFADGLPKTGIIKIYVSDGRDSVVKKCFYVSNPDFVKRDLDKSRFVFSLNDAGVFLVEDEKLDLIYEPGNYAFLENKDYLPHRDWLTFCIGSKTDYAAINIFRARPCRELYFGDIRFKLGDLNEPSRIPFILREKFRIRTIDQEGVKNVFCSRDIWMDPDVNLQSITDYIGNNNNIKRDKESGIAYYQYASKRIHNAEDCYYSISPKVFFKYKFYRWNLRSNCAPVPVETEYNSDKKELMVKCGELAVSDIVFQSLKEEQPYNYVRPLYSHNEPWERIYSLDVILNCIEVASQHNVYFAMFYPIRKWVQSQKDLFDIFSKFCKRRNYNLKNEDYKNLHRFAHEFCFEWILLSRDRWMGFNDKYRHIIKNLFQTTPFIRKEKEWMERVIELYFSKLNMDFRRDNNTAAGIVLQCMRCKRGDKQFSKDDNYSEKINRLESIYQDEHICYNIYQKLSNLR